MRLPFILHVFSSLCFALTATLGAVSLSRPDCEKKCGNIIIPYPFGIRTKCSANSSFTVICQNSTIPPKPLLSSINLEIVKISLNGTVTVNLPVSPINCSDELRTEPLPISLEGTPFSISAYYNSMVVMGCKNSVWLRTNATAVGGCMAICDVNSTDTTCNGVNCCQTSIPRRLQELQYTYESIQASNSSFCGYVFPTDKQWLQNELYKRYKGLVSDLSNPFDPEFGFAPLILEWELGTGTNFSNNSSCDYVSSTRYCSCSFGYEGNPYIVEGCTDIDECIDAKLHNCGDSEVCINTEGSFQCENVDGHLDGNPSNGYPQGFFQTILKGALIFVGSMFGLQTLVIAAWKFGKAITEIIKAIKASRKYMFFKRNGGILLEQQLAAIENGIEKIRLFSSTELAKATDDYNENRVLGRGGEGIVYKGMLEDRRIVAVKKSERVNQGDVEAFINEVIIVSQINHRNVVKLLGCCLESEVPRLVYEFIPNGTLFSHIHHPQDGFPLLWEMRIRIAKEVAGALAYLHSSACVPIYHRDIKSTNILLDEKCRAKISDFGTSRSISIDQTHVTTRVVGTFGYLDPEYFQSNQFTEKSDVYSYGVVLVELLTGEKAISAARVEEGRGLAMHFLYSMEQNQLFDIVDARVLGEGKREEIQAMAEVARKCLHLNGKSRPTMKEVACDLETIPVEKQKTEFPQDQMAISGSGSGSGCSSIEDIASDGFSSISEIVELPSFDEFHIALAAS